MYECFDRSAINFNEQTCIFTAKNTRRSHWTEVNCIIRCSYSDVFWILIHMFAVTTLTSSLFLPLLPIQRNGIILILLRAAVGLKQHFLRRTPHLGMTLGSRGSVEWLLGSRFRLAESGCKSQDLWLPASVISAVTSVSFTPSGQMELRAAALTKDQWGCTGSKHTHSHTWLMCSCAQERMHGKDMRGMVERLEIVQ